MKVAIAVLCVLVGAASAFDFCSICEAGVQEVISLANGNVDKAKSLLEGECKSHLDHTWEIDACDFAVDEAVKEIMKYVNENLNAQQVCAKVHLCSSRSALEEARLGENQLCQYCDTAVQQVISALENGNLLSQAAAICDKLGVGQERCDMVINYIKALISKYGKDPNAVCARFLPFCSSSQASFQEKITGGQLCQYCDEAVAEIISALQNGNIASEAEAICQKLGVGSALCQQVIGYLEGLLSQLGNDPKAVCAKFLPFCASSSMLVRQAPKANGGALCPYCEEGVTVLKNLLVSNAGEIVNELKSLCSKLPSSEAGICSDLVGQYGATIIDKLSSLLNPQSLCTAIKLCTAGLYEPPVQVGDGVDWDPVKCNFCKMVFEFIQQNFMSTDFENALLMDLAKACKAIQNQKYQQECMDILASYGDMILNYIKSLISPDHMCPLMKACPKPTVPSFLA